MTHWPLLAAALGAALTAWPLLAHHDRQARKRRRAARDRQENP
ncbi:hypothetical protein ACIPIC_02735 [Streptomyces collinus]